MRPSLVKAENLQYVNELNGLCENSTDRGVSVVDRLWIFNALAKSQSVSKNLHVTRSDGDYGDGFPAQTVSLAVIPPTRRLFSHAQRATVPMVTKQLIGKYPAIDRKISPRMSQLCRGALLALFGAH
jgi:hypothetical protein